MEDINAATVILSFIITWSIGLAPPVLVRFAILKRPMEKWPAISVCSLLWFLNIIIFTALGSQSKTHAALVLIAFVSYGILRRSTSVSQPQPTSLSGNGDFKEEDNKW